MTTVTRAEIERCLQAQLVEDFIIIGQKYTLNSFGAAKVQVAQLEDLLERMDKKVATTLQVLRSNNTIKTELPFLKTKITNMENNLNHRRFELGEPSPVDNPKNTLANFKEMVTKLEGAVKTLDDALPELEKEDAKRINLQGQRLWALSAIGMVGLIFLRSKW